MKSSSVLIAALLLLAACKKEYSVENVPQPPKQEPQPISNTEVLTVGSILETINRAAYWVDSNFFYVEPTSKEYSIAYGIEKYNGTIITVGESGLPTRPCYWVNGIKHLLPVPAGVSPVRATAIDIRTLNNTIYILSSVSNNNSFIWKLTNIGTTPEIILLKAPSNASKIPELVAKNMAVKNDSLVVFGSYRASFGNGTVNVIQPCIWRITSSSNVSVIVPENSMITDVFFPFNFFTPYGDANNQHTYMISSANSGRTDSLYIWTEQGRYFTINIPYLTQYLAHKCKIDDQGNLYIFYAVTIPSSHVAIVKITPQKQIKNLPISIPAGYEGSARGMDVLGNEYVFGVVYYDPKKTYYENYGFIQKNDMRIPLHIANNSLGIEVNCTRIFKK